jgi:hypothetical protein
MTISIQGSTQRRHSGSRRRRSRRGRFRAIRYTLFALAWGLVFLGMYSMVSGYASAPMDSDGNIDGSLMMPMMILLACLGAAAGCVLIADRFRK